MRKKKKTKRHVAKSGQHALKKTGKHRSLFDTAKRFFADQPWHYLGGEDIFCMRVPEEPHPVVVMILGAAGEEFGISTIRGPFAVGIAHMIISGESFDHSQIDMMSLSLDRYKKIPNDIRRFYKRAGVKPSSDATVPMFYVKQPYQVVREPTVEEVETLLYVINGTLTAMARGLVRSGETVTSSGLLTLKLSGDPFSPDIEVTGDFTVPTIEQSPTPTMLVDRSALKQLPVLDETWIVTCRRLPIRIKGISDEIRILLVVDEYSGMILDAETVHGAEAIVQSARHLVDLMLGKTTGSALQSVSRVGRPRGLSMIDADLYAVLGTQLNEAGIACELVTDTPPEMQEALDGLIEHMGRP